MAKKSRQKKIVRNSSKFQVRKGRFIAKFRLITRGLRAKHFVYLDEHSVVGSFSNDDIFGYMDKFVELLEMTVGSLDDILEGDDSELAQLIKEQLKDQSRFRKSSKSDESDELLKKLIKKPNTKKK
jgi:hypothetical protein